MFCMELFTIFSIGVERNSMSEYLLHFIAGSCVAVLGLATLIFIHLYFVIKGTVRMHCNNKIV